MIGQGQYCRVAFLLFKNFPEITINPAAGITVFLIDQSFCQCRLALIHVADGNYLYII